MTEAQLRSAAQVLSNMVKNELRNTGNCNGIICVINGGVIRRMRSVEKIIIEKAGVDWLNHGAAKEAVFQIIRMSTKRVPTDAIGFACVTNKFASTAKLNALPHEEAMKILRDSGMSNTELVARGWMHPPRDAVHATAQTPTHFCSYSQDYDPKERMFTGEPQVIYSPIEDWSGRMRFFEKEAIQ